MKSTSFTKNLGWIIPISLIILSLIIGLGFILNSKVDTPNKEIYLNIKSQTTKKELIDQIKSQDIIFNSLVFEFYSKAFRYHIPRTGRYKIENGMKVLDLVRKLSRREQDPIRLIIGKSRTKQEFSNKISQSLEFSSKDILNKLNDNNFLIKYGVDSLNSLGIVIPNTYEVYWDIGVEGFFKRMHREYNKFWEKKNIDNHPLSKKEIIILASIVEEETNKDNEKSRIAGVYINRLKINMPLQADPTIKFSIGDFEIKRIQGQMMGIDSPYNTYKNTGLPPGPICIPSISSIDGVINYEKHDYIYFCAKDDFSGYHNFANTFSEHLINAQRYHKALNTIK